MEIIFNEKYWGLIIIISLLTATGIAWLFYYKSRDMAELTPMQRYFLTVLRFATVLSVALLLTGPLIKSLRKMVQNPLIILAVDNSESMTVPEDKERLQELAEQAQKSLGQRFDLITYIFDQKAVRKDNPDFSGKGSAYGNMLQTIYNNHFNDNVGALVILGDGIHNQGENPVNVVRQLNYPVYTFAVGDTTAYKDAGITSVRTNRNAFSGNKFPVEADIRYHGIPGQSLRFSISHNGNVVFSELIYTGYGSGFQTMSTYLEADSPGLKYYTVTIESGQDEKNKNNNVRQFVINVLDNKQKILIISNGAHPDAGAIRDALESQINYEVSLYTAEPYPADLRDYNLLILCQIPSSAQSGRILFEEAARLRVPKLILLGSQSHIQQFNQLMPGVEIQLQAGNFEDAQPSLNKDFVAFTLSERLIENFEKYPPLKVPFGRYQMDGMWTNLATQRIRNIVTDRPVLSFSNQNGVKNGVIFGEGIWRWRMYNYLMSESHIEFNEFVDKTVQYLATRDNEDNFLISFRPVYQETESVIMTAEVYNDAYEAITTPEVSMVLRDSLKQEYVYLFDRGTQFYRLDAGVLPPGSYNFEAKVEIGDVTYNESGSFAVIPVDIELMQTEANHRMLYQLSQSTGGRFFVPAGMDDLTENIMEDTRIKPFSYFQTLLNEILNLRWIFFILLFVMSLEWFLRKYWGIY